MITTNNLNAAERTLGSIARRYFNLDAEPKIINPDEKINILLRLNFDKPSVNRDINNICDVIEDIIKFSQDLNLAWNYVEIIETVTYEEVGAVAGGAVGGIGGYHATKNNLGTAILLALGTMLGHLIGKNYEVVSKIVCKYMNYLGTPIIVAKNE